MPQFFPQVFITGVVLFLLMGAGYGITQAARAIPWDCSDWQAFAHADRTIAILESLAENRGKTLYCGVDQSDTFSKAETWEAGKDRNERDDTVYFGERGSFRGFIAAQEGWLTEGESGITGVSIDRIFEFPREKKKRRRRIKYERLPLEYGRTYPGVVRYQGPAPNYENLPRSHTNAYVHTNWGGTAGAAILTSLAAAQTSARDSFVDPTQEEIDAIALNGNSTPATGEVSGGAGSECRTHNLFGDNTSDPKTRVIRLNAWLDKEATWDYRDGVSHAPGSSPPVYHQEARPRIHYEAVCKRRK